MKKLFFAALLATVAVGGALTTNATTYYGPIAQGALAYDCSGSDNLCSQISGNIYRSATVQTPETLVDKTTLPATQRFDNE